MVLKEQELRNTIIFGKMGFIIVLAVTILYINRPLSSRVIVDGQALMMRCLDQSSPKLIAPLECTEPKGGEVSVVRISGIFLKVKAIMFLQMLDTVLMELH